MLLESGNINKTTILYDETKRLVNTKKDDESVRIPTDNRYPSVSSVVKSLAACCTRVHSISRCPHPSAAELCCVSVD